MHRILVNIYQKLTGAHILLGALVLLLLSYLAVYFIDLQGIWGLRDHLVAQYDSYPFFWYHWFEDGGPVEQVQYLLLGFGALFSVRNATLEDTKIEGPNKAASAFWYLLGLALLLMLIEDAGNPRHMLRVHLRTFTGEAQHGPIGTAAELGYFAVLAAIPIYAYLAFGRKALSGYRATTAYLLAGYLVYAMGVGASFAGTAFHDLLDQNVYMMAGRRVLDTMTALADPAGAELYAANKEWISFYLMDSMIEESIELIGAALLLAACISYAKSHASHDRASQLSRPHAETDEEERENLS